MRTIYLTLFAALLGLSACEWGKPPIPENNVFTDTLAYEYKTIHERAADCGDKPDSTCTTVDIKYPIFNEQAKLNDTIVAKLLSMFAYEKPDSNLTIYVKNFLKQYQDFRKDDPRSEMFFALNSYAKVLLQDSGLVTLETGGYTFQGGAHGSSYTGYINWDTKANKNLDLKDIVVDGSYNKLTKIAEGIFRKDEKLTDASSLANDYFFKDNKFALNENFSVTPLGLKFLYNQYEIKPYAAGQTELLVPYAQIKQLMRPNTVVSHYVK
ncbi:MAG: DUF3298 domain-containing protein [Sphingobacteriaceae bacterium]|nr:MAG: DUF3298 domain-containing protein [Sphingobacteriaceae bacterium]